MKKPITYVEVSVIKQIAKDSRKVLSLQDPANEDSFIETSDSIIEMMNRSNKQAFTIDEFNGFMTALYQWPAWQNPRNRAALDRIKTQVNDWYKYQAQITKHKVKTINQQQALYQVARKQILTIQKLEG